MRDNIETWIRNDDLKALLDYIGTISAKQRWQTVFCRPYTLEDKTGLGGNRTRNAQKSAFTTFECGSLLEMVARKKGSYYWLKELVLLLPEADRDEALRHRDAAQKTCFERIIERNKRFKIADKKRSDAECQARHHLLYFSLPIADVLQQIEKATESGSTKEVTDNAMKEALLFSSALKKIKTQFLDSNKNKSAMLQLINECRIALTDITQLVRYPAWKKIIAAFADAVSFMCHKMDIFPKWSHRCSWFAAKTKIADARDSLSDGLSKIDPEYKRKTLSSRRSDDPGYQCTHWHWCP